MKGNVAFYAAATVNYIYEVKCEDILRRITCYRSIEGNLNLNLDTLRMKIRFMFQIAHDSDFKLSYIDEDGDEITLIDEIDLHEAITQCLNPLRINITLINMYETKSESSFETSSSRNKSAEVEHLSSFTNYANAKENNLGNVLSKLSNELVEKSACLVLSNLIESLSKSTISTLVEGKSPHPVSTNYPDSAKCCENQHVENQTCERSSSDKLDLSPSGDCPKYATVSLTQAFVHELYSSRFVFDLNGPDITYFAPNATFSKKLRLSNNGVRAWPYKSKLVWIGGDRLTDDISADIEIPADGLPVGKEVDVAVNFRAPKSAGDYVSFWKMSLPTGETFGQRIWVSIQVYDPLKYSKEFDLNYPPPGCVQDDDNMRSTSTKSVDDRELFQLKVLEEMGFKFTYLNKEILRWNAYDLKKTVTDLFGISDSYQFCVELENVKDNNKQTDMMALENMKNFIMGRSLMRPSHGSISMRRSSNIPNLKPIPRPWTSCPQP